MQNYSQVLRGDDVQRVLAGLYQGTGRAALGDPFIGVQGGINPFVQEVMVGLPRSVVTPGRIIFRSVGVDAIKFSYKTFGKERFLKQDTRRPALAPFKWAQRPYAYTTEQLERRGFVSVADRDEIANAGSISSGLVNDLAVRKAFEAREQVDNDLESVRATLLNATASYALTPTTLSTPWDDASGDSRADIQTIAWALANANNVQPMQIGVVLTHASYQAAQSDPTMIAALTAGGGGARDKIGFSPTAAQMRDYWGVGDVQVADWFQTDPATPDTLASAYGDNAYLYILRDAMQGFDSRESSNDFACDFDWSRAGGLALDPVEKTVEVEGIATATLFPWESWTTPRIVNTSAGALLKNTKT
jgi:hypothetical protein